MEKESLKIGNVFDEIDRSNDQARVDVFEGEFEIKKPIRKRNILQRATNALKEAIHEIKVVEMGQDDHIG